MFPLTSLHRILGKARSLFGNFGAAKAPAKPRATIAAEPMGPAEHWSRATRAVLAAIGSANAARTFQAGAARQIDSAGYALDLLLDDLATVMMLPPRAAGAPVLARIEPQPARRYEPLQRKRSIAA